MLCYVGISHLRERTIKEIKQHKFYLKGKRIYNEKFNKSIPMNLSLNNNANTSRGHSHRHTQDDNQYQVLNTETNENNNKRFTLNTLLKENNKERRHVTDITDAKKKT